MSDRNDWPLCDRLAQDLGNALNEQNPIKAPFPGGRPSQHKLRDWLRAWFLTEAPSDPAPGDRGALLYLMQQFDGEVLYCPCGRSHPTADFDSAIFLRGYLSSNERPAPLGVKALAELLWDVGKGPDSDGPFGEQCKIHRMRYEGMAEAAIAALAQPSAAEADTPDTYELTDLGATKWGEDVRDAKRWRYVAHRLGVKRVLDEQVDDSMAGDREKLKPILDKLESYFLGEGK